MKQIIETFKCSFARIFKKNFRDDSFDHLGFDGYLPERLNSSVAHTLEQLLRGKRINCMSATNGKYSTRLKDQIASLRMNYGWKGIESDYKTICTLDGRLQRVKEYWLDPRAIEAAELGGAKDWLAEMRQQRQKRKQAGKAVKNSVHQLGGIS